MEDLNTVLSPFAPLTDLLSGETYTTSSSVLPIIEHIRDITLPSKDETLRVNTIREKIAHYIYPR